jgi:pyruvate dehydrogenase E1 component alpha subunit
MASKKPSARKTSMKAKSEPNAQPRPKAKPSPKTADKKVGKPRGKSIATAKKAQGANSARGKARSQAGPQSKPKAILDDATLLGAWRDMVEIRRFEERAGQLYAMGKIGGFCHLYIGQEAVAVGMQLCVKPGDQVVTGYRDHAHMLASGMEAPRVMAELTGRRDGYSKGKGGSMHMFSVEKNFYGGHGIVGAQVPIGTGLALANKYRGTPAISFVYFGDGAANQGQVYESFNMAELWRLPVIYVIENNRYAMGTSVQRASAQTNLSQRGISFNIPGAQVDGMDVEAVYEAGQRARDWVEAGKGPFILEMLTYRYRGHSMSDPAKYRKREEVDDMREHHDPIMHTEQALIARGVVNEDDLKNQRKTIYDAIADAVDYALDSPLPDASELTTDVLAEADHAN